MRALVIGGNGFIGSCLVERLRAQGHALRVLDPSQQRTDIDWSGVEYVRGNLLQEDVLPGVLKGVDIVFHLASSTVPSTSNLDPQADVQTNLVGALKLCRAMIADGMRRLVFFSSGGTVYGDPELLPVPESHALRPISSYGVVKAAIENYLFMYQSLGQMDPLILRPSNPYGARQSGAGLQGVVAAFLDKAQSGESVRIWGDGKIVRDYLFIDDLINLAAQAAGTPYSGVVNVGSGEGHSLNEVLDIVRKVTGKALPVTYDERRAFDVAEIVLDISRATSVFDWKPSVDMEEGVRITWQKILES